MCSLSELCFRSVFRPSEEPPLSLSSVPCGYKALSLGIWIFCRLLPLAELLESAVAKSACLSFFLGTEFVRPRLRLT